MALMEQQAREQKDRGWRVSALSGSLAALMRLPPLRLPPPSKANKLVLDKSYCVDVEESLSPPVLNKATSNRYAAKTHLEVATIVEERAPTQPISDQSKASVNSGYLENAIELIQPMVGLIVATDKTVLKESRGRLAHSLRPTRTAKPEIVAPLPEPIDRDPWPFEIGRIGLGAEPLVRTCLTSELQPAVEAKV
jgi:hypothetical protein